MHRPIALAALAVMNIALLPVSLAAFALGMLIRILYLPFLLLLGAYADRPATPEQRKHHTKTLPDDWAR